MTYLLAAGHEELHESDCAVALGRQVYLSYRGAVRNCEEESANEHDLGGALTFHNEAHVQLLLASHVHLKLAGVHALRLTVRSDAVGVDMATKGTLRNVNCFIER